jgi:UDP-galactopyranose mutase
LKRVDAVIVGAGLTGSTIARMLTDAGRVVLIVERRKHSGGNVHDTVHSSGIRVHTYGPHYFRCNSRRIWDYALRFGSFFPYEAKIKTQIDGHLENWPIDESIISRYAPHGWHPQAPQATSFEEVCLGRMPAEVYRQFIQGYTEKQWGCPANTLDPALATRIRINPAGETRLTPDRRFQGLPSGGYANWMQQMIAGIELWLGFDFLKHRSLLPAHDTLIFTGPIDEYFGYDLGPLAYRTQRRQVEFLADKTHIQPCAQVNYPSARKGPIRTIEWKHLDPEPARLEEMGTVITTETPGTAHTPEACEYPFPDAANKSLYERYRSRAEELTNVVFCGRLGEYRYMDMDQAIGRAMTIAEKLLRRDSVTLGSPEDPVPARELA